MSKVEIIAKIESMLRNNGSDLYGGEAVTQTEHALQCAMLAESEGASAKLVAAALLHDIGHLLDPEFEAALDRDEDLFHEELGEKFLERWFDEEVTQPVKLHVDAKRYLCATDPEYFSQLSPSSVHTLELQGGPMNREEVTDFEQNRYFREAIRLRIWDDLAKNPEKRVVDVGHFMKFLSESLRPSA